eukprot:CAMPEP_0116148062 /NCGR_PEP_ID=MMETSP0329-20121206/18125_1 /TAXON_ID=697910 /ORGANISM="Pseudo-nitzschia arenysensis, Strain B593" /LENGTH=986 /DNA_ID=CAMNT_0003644107 /DNA_START=431 /DNA_END=3391 /DNA_ORIENTATION=-
MPSQSRGFFACDYCGLQLDTLEEALEHEQTCPSRRTIGGHLPAHPQQQQQPQQPPNYFLQQQQRHGLIGMGPLAPGAEGGAEGYGNPYARAAPYARYGRGMPPITGDTGPEAQYPPKSGKRTPGAETRCFPLVNYPPDRTTDILTMIDTTACQNIEVFEATPDVITGYELISGRRVAPKQVGLRCRNCGSGSNNNSGIPSRSEAGAILFPEDLVSVGSCARQIADHHLINCRQTNPDVQDACQRAASKRQRGMVGLTEGATNDGGDDQASKAALVNYCVGVCQQVGIGNKSNNKSGIGFAGVGGMAPTSLQGRRDAISATASATDQAYSTPFASAQSQPGYGETPPNFPFSQEADRTWHCIYCKHIPHQYRDSQSIWSSPGGGPPPSSFMDQHLSLCRAYRQHMSSMPPGGGGMLARQTPFGMNPYGAPAPSPYGMTMHGQPPPNPTAPWDPTMPMGGAMQSGPGQYSSLMGPHDQSFRYGQPPPYGVGNPHAIDAGMGGARFLSTLGPGGYPDRGGPLMPSVPSTGVRNPSYALGSGNNTTDLMKEAMTFLANYEAEYYARDPESAKIPKLVLDEDHLLLTDYFFYLMKQLRLVRFTENDRKTRGGKREKIKIGYGGLQCIHCADLPMSRKFFWSNVDRLANSFAEIPGHILKCRRCPQANKDALLLLKKGHPEQMSKLPRGSQKIFFRRMWRRVHEGDPQDDVVVVESPKAASPAQNPRPPVPSIKTSPEKDTKSLEEVSHSGSITVTSDETILVMQRSAKEAAKALAQSAVSNSGPPSPSSRILVAIPEDKEWLSDIDSYVRRQLEVFCATEADVAAAREDRKYPITVGQVGIRCIHCAIAQGNDAIGHAIAYPFSISGIYESVKEFHRLHLETCPNLPNTSKAKLGSMKGASSLSSVLRKYYTLSAKALGLVDTKDGIRTGGVSAPIGSLAAFTFSETEDGSPAKSREGNEDMSRLSGKKRATPPSAIDGAESNQKYAKRNP